MTRATDRVRSVSLLLLAAVSVGFLSGCGDPSPSTKLAPDKPPMDMSKMSPEEIKKLDEKAQADAKATAPGGAPTGG